MKNKNLVSLSVALVFFGLSVTGLMIYFGRKSHAVDHIHAWFGVLFVAAAIFHVLNNWSSLKGYTTDRKSGRLRAEFILPAVVATIFALGIGYDVPVFSSLANMGKKAFGAPRPKREADAAQLSFVSIATPEKAAGTALHLQIQPDTSVKQPVVVVWVEDSAHRFVENLFVPAQLAQAQREPGPPATKPFDPGLLTGWRDKAGNHSPTYDKATPAGPFFLRTSTAAQGSYYVMLAISAQGRTSQYEAKVMPGQNIYRFTPSGADLLRRAILEVN